MTVNMLEVDKPAGRPVIHRRYAPKTRNGCITCKIRRIKCDESKPFCKRCTSTGRKCDGYTPSTTPDDNAKTTESLQSSLTVDVRCDGLEKRTFDYFRSKTAPRISGYFRDSVWNQTILQVSHSEPAVRYAINALGALHEEISLKRKTKQAVILNAPEFRTKFPMKQYTKAINEMQKLLKSSNTPIDVILLCAIVFVHFESLNESFVPALIHLENSIRLLRSQPASSKKPIDPGVVQAILRMDVQASVYLGMRIPGLPYYLDESECDLPTGFKDLTHARDVVNTWTCRLFHYMRAEADEYKFREPGNVPLEVLAKTHDLERTFLGMDRLLYEFMQKMSNRLTKREQHGLDMLRVRVKTNRVLTATCVYSEASAFDAYLDEFEEVLLLCEYTMHNDDFDSWLFSVTLDEGLISPLWTIAASCRDSRIRHRALALMKKLPGKQGIWYLQVMTQTAEACIRYEEALCEKDHPLCEDIPEWRRVHSSGLGGWDVSTPKTTVNAHLRTRPNGMDGEWCHDEEPIELLKEHYHSHGIPALVEAYPGKEEIPPLQTSVALHTEPWMATLPNLLKAPHSPPPGNMRSLGAFGLVFGN